MKTKLIFLCCFLWTGIFAQTSLQKGTILIGASSNLLGNLTQIGFPGISNNAGLMFSNSKREVSGGGFSFKSEDKITILNISPSVGYFFTDRLLVSLPLGIFFLKEGDDSFTLLSLTPAVRGYFKTSGKTMPYLEARGGFSRFSTNDGDDDTQTTNMFGGKLGANTFLSSKVALNYFLDYLYAFEPEKTQNNVTSKSTDSIFGFGIGLDIFL